ncbi:DUF2620 family protein [Escherichia coli]|nr:DUF2620 family protein [Escherichia coli]UMT20209.1 DUF2620 domain-containing protein [Escherichia coli]HAH8985578.1 DUF2620 family protein [Escherichia coli]
MSFDPTGYTLAHEHLHIDLSGFKNNVDCRLDQYAFICQEMNDLMTRGVRNVIEMTNRYIPLNFSNKDRLMKKIGVAGLQREQIKKTIEATAPGSFEVFIHNDMEAAMKVKSGQLDYYIGACNTGAGAALSIAIAVIGYNKSCTIAKPGIKAKDEHIAKMIAEGKVAFGLSVEHVEHAIPMLINHLK